MQLTNTFKNGKEKMMSTANKLNNVIQQIMPHLSEATNGVMNKIGLVAIPAGLTNAAVTKAIETQNETWLSISEVGGIVSIVGAIVFMVNIFYKAHSLRRKTKCDLFYAEREDQRRQEAHDKAMNNDNSAP